MAWNWAINVWISASAVSDCSAQPLAVSWFWPYKPVAFNTWIEALSRILSFSLARLCRDTWIDCPTNPDSCSRFSWFNSCCWRSSSVAKSWFLFFQMFTACPATPSSCATAVLFLQDSNKLIACCCLAVSLLTCFVTVRHQNEAYQRNISNDSLRNNSYNWPLYRCKRYNNSHFLLKSTFRNSTVGGSMICYP